MISRHTHLKGLALALPLAAALLMMIGVWSALVAYSDIYQSGPTFSVNDPAGTDDGACTQVNCTLREAVRAANTYNASHANSGATIELVTGTVYCLTHVDNGADDDANGLPVITTSVTLNAYGATIERGAAATETFRILEVGAPGELRLNDATIRNGLAAQGGGIHSSGVLSMSHCTIISNTAHASQSNGGGIANVGGRLHVADSTFHQNRATSAWTYGAAIYSSGGTLTILDSTFSENSASSDYESHGGGIYSAGSTLTIARSLFGGNAADDAGGGLYVSSGLWMVVRSRFFDNVAAEGGAFYLTGNHSGRIVNSIFVRNAGSVLYLGSTAKVEVIHTTIVSPTVGAGEAIRVADGTVQITNTVVASYTTGISATGGIVIEDYDLFFGNALHRDGVLTGTHSLVGDPAFADPYADNYHLMPHSTAIDRGANAGIAIDLDGSPRPWPAGGGFDIGVYECPYWRIYLSLTLRNN